MSCLSFNTFAAENDDSSVSFNSQTGFQNLPPGIQKVFRAAGSCTFELYGLFNLKVISFHHRNSCITMWVKFSLFNSSTYCVQPTAHQKFVFQFLGETENVNRSLLAKAHRRSFHFRPPWEVVSGVTAVFSFIPCHFASVIAAECSFGQSASITWFFHPLKLDAPPPTNLSFPTQTLTPNVWQWSFVWMNSSKQ